MGILDIFKQMDQTVLNTFGTDQFNITVEFVPASSGVPQTINGIMAPPPLLEQLQPGQMNDGPTNVWFFVPGWINISPNPQIGDVLVINGTSYALMDLDVDTISGARLKLRRNAS